MDSDLDRGYTTTLTAYNYARSRPANSPRDANKLRTRRIYKGEYQRRAQWWTKYRLRWHQVMDMWAAQGFRCAVCRELLVYQEIHIDHDHACCAGMRTCGKCVRGILCKGCNVGIGEFRDSPTHLRAAANYLDGLSK